jgi:hypothetical protein
MAYNKKYYLQKSNRQNFLYYYIKPLYLLDDKLNQKCVPRISYSYYLLIYLILFYEYDF